MTIKNKKKDPRHRAPLWLFLPLKSSPQATGLGLLVSGFADRTPIFLLYHKIFILVQICYTLEIEPYHLSEKARQIPDGVITVEASGRAIPARIGN